MQIKGEARGSLERDYAWDTTDEGIRQTRFKIGIDELTRNNEKTREFYSSPRLRRRVFEEVMRGYVRIMILTIQYFYGVLRFCISVRRFWKGGEGYYVFLCCSFRGEDGKSVAVLSMIETSFAESHEWNNGALNLCEFAWNAFSSRLIDSNYACIWRLSTWFSIMQILIGLEAALHAHEPNNYNYWHRIYSTWI